MIEFDLLKPGLIFCIVSFFVFYFVNGYLIFFIPNSARKTTGQTWKWKNITTSFIHSFITGIWACLSFYYYPEMAEDLINISSSSSRYLVSFSVGYFAFDFFDMALNHRKKSSYELMVHHIFVIACFGLSVITEHYIGYAVVALLVELNSVFLHLRQLMIITDTNKRAKIYRWNALLNVATFIAFRIAVLGWMTRWLVLHRDVLSVPAYSLGSVGMAVVVVMNIILFYRVCIVDFSWKRQKVKTEFDSREEISNLSTNHLLSKSSSLHIS